MTGETERPLVSIVVPTKNGRDTIEACLRGIFSQSLVGQIEVIVIDSGSEDATLDIAKKFPARIHQIPTHEFNHGATRNLGVQLARGEFVVMTVQDAAPADHEWLANLLRPFLDPEVAAVCGRQIVPHDADKNPLSWSRPISEPQARRVSFSPGEFVKLPPEQQLDHCGWDDVCAAYRRKVLLELPFKLMSFGEDFTWARDALAQGKALVYEPRARVIHYHKETFSIRFRRAFATQYFYHRTFGCRPRGKFFLSAWMRATYLLFKWQEVSWARKPKWLLYNYSLELAEWWARFRFSLTQTLRGDAALERLHKRICGQPSSSAKTSASPENSRLECAQ